MPQGWRTLARTPPFRVVSVYLSRPEPNRPEEETCPPRGKSPVRERIRARNAAEPSRSISIQIASRRVHPAMAPNTHHSGTVQHATRRYSRSMLGRLDRRADIAFDLPEASVPCITRTLLGRTQKDVEVDEMAMPAEPMSVWVAVLALRIYRRVRPASVGNRCVCDPSCSRYAELAIRQRGLMRGILAMTLRLIRCRPGRGGVDMP